MLGDEHPGPILSLLGARNYDHLVLLHEPHFVGLKDQLLVEIRRLRPSISIRSENLPPCDEQSVSRTSDYLQALLESIRARHPQASVHVSLNPVNPGTNVAWMRLVYRNSGLSLLQVRPHLHASSARPLVEIVEESAPQAQPAVQALREAPEPLADDVARALEMVGSHPSFRQLLDRAASLARFDAPVLIYGESGSGKTVLANFIWKTSRRSRNPMRNASPVDLPDPMAYALIFGNTEAGARSGQRPGKGLVESCGEEGTLLIENIESLGARAQEALCTYLGTGEFTPLGSSRPIRSRTRLILTCADDLGPDSPRLLPCLRSLLAPTSLRMPPLRERREDIPLIALHYLRRINLSLRQARSISRDMLRSMQEHHWHDNVRELRIAIERTALLFPAQELGIGAMCVQEDEAPSYGAAHPSPMPEIGEGFSLESYLGDLRKRLIMRALELSRGNQSEAARLLGITPQAVHQFVKFHFKPQRKSPAQ